MDEKRSISSFSNEELKEELRRREEGAKKLEAIKEVLIDLLLRERWIASPKWLREIADEADKLLEADRSLGELSKQIAESEAEELSFFNVKKGIAACGYELPDGRFLVRKDSKGAKLTPHWTDPSKASYKSMAPYRDELNKKIAAGDMVATKDGHLVVKDTVFTNRSYATKILNGGSESKNRVWSPANVRRSPA